MTQTKIFGHQNPDTDTITSAIVTADIEEQLGNDAAAYRLGEIGAETEYALNHFGVKAPELLESLEEGAEVILVDHNEFQQSAENIEKADILKVYDHHRIANFQTESPLYYRAEPVGCTATILKKVYEENDLLISQEMAGLMLSAIISDTLLFKSPTTTEADRTAAQALAEMADIEIEGYGIEMLKSGASTKDKTADALITADAKSFEMGQRTTRIAQINVIDVDEVFDRRDELENAINRQIEQEGYDLFVLVVTDILNSNSRILALGTEAQSVEKAFDVALDENSAILEGVVSRKKQVVPQITKALS
ncbi:manganese-dependent inorganic pyrophosphatase [Salinicoccus sp. ID82-1]|uniref:Probable manganese-dependent inorganic pyrophosphatase n=1 Tax=Salinicoccus cyprini TaxID=2493691 RepID=A0A558ATT8_9STAP|nr:MULTISPECIES: manganese-dependent inorganic pyrophosphatase [Salinicoccus]MCG1010843.1 manganese-dependent inorganic pyrophosphatase [Salinicoccus sp. ID82-1]TVT27679.1 manganese-dependent inorganic pyrophosphatase [Salinicoccus cyprini]